ncbi:glycosyltransferase family 4 protein [Candidatus Latescibacterota bacterium]
MKILLVNWMDMENPMAGGAEVHLNEIFSRFVRRGDEVTQVSSGYKGCPETGVYDGIKIIRTGNRETFNFAAPRVLRRLDREMNFDLIVEDINKVPLFTPLYLKKPILTVIPHLFGSTVYQETNPVLASYVYCMERPIPYVYRNAVFEVISESTAADIVKRGVNAEHVRVVHCGMDHDMYNIDESIEKFEQKTILYVGRIKKYKSVDVIIKALPEILTNIPGARLVIVGSGDNLDELKRLAKKLGVSENVVFTGFVSMDEKVDWMRRSHVIVNPSPKEGWGLTNIEANACGTTAVASDADGLRDSVKDGETGLLFPYGNHAVLAEKVIRVLSDNELYARLTKNSIAWAKTFTWDDCAEKTMKIADEIVS